MEALYQSATGAGYDQNCNGIYDSATDVKPFFATSDDPYGGTAGQGFSATSSGGGEIGGFGFRDYALPILIYATDNELRDPEAGYPSPGGCPMDAHRSDVVDALADLRGYTIGIMTSSGGGTGPVSQMEELGEATGSMADIDGDGVADDLLVFTWTGSSSAFREIITSSVGDLVNSTQFSTVKLLVEGDDWSPVDDEDEDVEHDTGTTDTETTDTETTDTGSVDGDSETDETEDAASEELGFVRSIEPAVYEDIEPAAGFDVLDFTIQFEGIVPAMTHDQLFSITLNVVGDDTILLDTRDIIIVVPGLGS
jgi:hypothetical protein